MPRTVKVAVIGSGLAGLTAAHLLCLPCHDDSVEFEVHLFEKSSALGMDSSSISLTDPEGTQQWRIDVPMRSFQGGYYAQLIELYKSIGVQFRKADFTYSFSSLIPSKSEVRSIRTTFVYNGASGRAGFSKPAAFGLSQKDECFKGNASKALTWRIWSSLQFLIFIFQYVFCFLITLYHSLPFWRSTYLETIVFRDWVNRVAPRSYVSRLARMDVAWQSYVQLVLLPMFSAVCTSSAEDVMNHPMQEFLDYIWLTFGTHHYVVNGGVRSAVSSLTSKVKHIHLSSTILSLEPDLQNQNCAALKILSRGKTEEISGFKHVVLATPAPAAVSLLTSYINSLPESMEHRQEGILPLVQCLKAFQSQPSLVINHTDDTLLPDHEKDVRELNLITFAPEAVAPERKPMHLSAKFNVSPTYTMATQVLPRPKGYPRAGPTVFQSTNPIIPPRKETIISVADLQRAVVTLESKKALSSLCEKESLKWWQCPYQAKTRLGPLQGGRPPSGPDAPGFWICGSFAHLGIPLLEGCVISAKNVVEQGVLKSEGVRWMN